MDFIAMVRGMDELHIDDAIDHLARHLAQKFAPDAAPVVAVSIQCAQQYDLEVKFVAEAFWMSRGVNIVNQAMREGEPYHRPFLDAAWHLCRIGVLRPGQKGPGVGVIGHSPDDGYSITSFGKGWVAVATQRPPTDPGSFLQIVQPFAARFGKRVSPARVGGVGLLQNSQLSRVLCSVGCGGRKHPACVGNCQVRG